MTNTKQKKEFKIVALGSGHELLPLMERDRSGLGVYEEGVLKVLSSNSPETTLRKLIIKSPVPSMHQPWYYEILKSIAHKLKPRVTVLNGPPGIGKTTLGQVLADATGMECHLIPCGYKITSEFIKETTVNGHRLNDVFSAVGKRLEEGDLSKQSLRKLQKTIPELLKPSDKSKAGYVLDWDGMPEQKYDLAMKQVRAVAKDERLIQEQAQGAGITTKNGKLLDILLNAIEHKEPTIIILDEFSRRRGDGGAMQGLYDMLAGKPEHESCTVEGGNGKEYTITNQDLRDAGVYVLITSNPRTPDDPDVKSLPGALADRLSPFPMSHATAQDLQHAYEREMAGLPIGTLYQAQQSVWEEDPKKGPTAFKEHLQRIQELGMDEHEKSRIDEHKRSFTSNWSGVTQGVQALAEFFDIARQVEDPECNSIRTPNRAKGENQPLFKEEPKSQAMINEINEKAEKDEDALARFGVRQMLKLHTDSMEMLPEPTKASEAHKKRGFTPDPYPETHYGDRAIRELNLLVQYRYPNPKSAVRNFLERKMARLGLLSAQREEKLDPETKKAIETETRESGGGRRPSVATLLNTPRELSVSKEARIWQELWVQHLREKYPDNYAADASAESILPINAVAKALERLPDELKTRLGEIGMSVNSIPLVNRVPDDEKGLHASQTVLIDAIYYNDEGKALPKEAYQAIDRQMDEKAAKGESPFPAWQRFLMTLAKPGAAAAIQPYLFTQGFSALDEEHKDIELSKLAENRSDTGLAITTLRIGETAGGAPNIVHVVKQDGDLLIIGSEKIHDHLRTLLQQQNVTYVDRRQPDARDIVNERVGRMIDAGREKARKAAVARGTPEEKSHEEVAKHDYNQLMHRAFRHRMQPSDELIKEAVARTKKTADQFVEEQDLFHNTTLPQLLLDDGKLTKAEYPVVMLELDLKDVPLRAKAAAGMAK